jgi:hypothetical protein
MIKLLMWLKFLPPRPRNPEPPQISDILERAASIGSLS